MEQNVSSHPKERAVVVIGAGPAGLAAAYELTRRSVSVLVLEKSPAVGGLARTEQYKGYRFDMGGHRFFTKSEEVQRIWKKVLGGDFLRRRRLSRIHYRGKFFDYPLRLGSTLRGLGLFASARIILSYLRWQLFPYRHEVTFEQWVTNRFGKRLFETFFKPYTEKVWGISCSELRAEWAAQRIKALTLRSAILSMFWIPRNTIRTLIDQFDYPRLGPGMMWDAVKDRVKQAGGRVLTEREVIRIHRKGLRVNSVVVLRAGETEELDGSDFISSMPITEFVRCLHPPPPATVRQAAAELTYRDFLTVCLIVSKKDLFPDQWIYVHDPEIKVSRIQNFKNWSAEMVPDPSTSSLGLEYFCTQGDDLWNRPDAELIALGKREVAHLGLARPEEVVDGCVFRVPKSYPVYDASYTGHLATLREFIDRLENVQTIGRNGLHRYNNQDHAMLTGMLAVDNLLCGARHDLWDVNADREYLEDIGDTRNGTEAGVDGPLQPEGGTSLEGMEPPTARDSDAPRSARRGDVNHRTE